MRLIDADKLCEYANNLADKSVDANEIMRFPRVDAEPVRHGRWEYVGGNLYRCSICHEGMADDDNILTGKENYCPNCGAKMDGGDS